MDSGQTDKGLFSVSKAHHPVPLKHGKVRSGRQIVHQNGVDAADIIKRDMLRNYYNREQDRIEQHGVVRVIMKDGKRVSDAS